LKILNVLVLKLGVKDMENVQNVKNIIINMDKQLIVGNKLVTYKNNVFFELLKRAENETFRLYKSEI
jgi:hypothetical protein